MSLGFMILGLPGRDELQGGLRRQRDVRACVRACVRASVRTFGLGGSRWVGRSGWVAVGGSQWVGRSGWV